MPAAVPNPGLLGIDEPNIRLVNERRRLKRAAWGLGGHPGGRQLAEFIVDQREQVLRRVDVASLNRRENLSNVAHVGPAMAIGEAITS